VFSRTRLYLWLWRRRDGLGNRLVKAYIWLEESLAPKRLRLSLLFGLVLVAGVGIALAKGLPFPSEAFWDHQYAKGLIVGGVVANGLASALLLADYRSLARAQATAEDLRVVCSDLATLVSQELSLDVTKIGVHVWEIHGIWPVRYLSRVASSLPKRRHAEIIWRKKKGAIGRCWKTHGDVYADIGDLMNVDEATLERLPPPARFHLRWREFSLTKKYPTIFAVPLREGRGARKLGGVLSVDLRVPGRTADLQAFWEAQETKINNILALCDHALAR
jgi:hypothetical protein